MSVFADAVLPVTVKTWTVDFSTFEKNPEAGDNKYRTPFFVPDEVEEAFNDCGLEIQVAWNFVDKAYQVVIKRAEEGDVWAGPTYRLNDGDTFAINSGDPMRVVPKGA